VRAAVISGIGQVGVETVPDPTPGPREVVIEVAAAGICGTDLHILQGEFAPTLPIIPGHEFSGTVVALGAEVTEVAVGDRVAADPSLHCGECYECRRGRGNMCERWAAIGVTHPGAVADFVAVPVKNCWTVPDSVTLDAAALVEPLSCAVRGYDVLRSQLANHVLIYGSGTMGLMMLELAKRAGAATVSIVDLNQDRLDTARLLGCTAAVTSADELVRPRGWDLVIDCTGAAAAISDGLGRVAKAGTFLQFGVSDYSTRVEIEPYKIYNHEITITGSMAVLHSFERAGELLAAGVLQPDVMISHRYPLEKFPDALDQFRAGIGRKILLTPSV